MLLNIGYIASLFCAFGDTVQNMPVDTVYIQAQRVEFCQLGRVKLEFHNSTSLQTLQNNLAANAVFLKQYGIQARQQFQGAVPMPHKLKSFGTVYP